MKIIPGWTYRDEDGVPLHIIANDSGGLGLAFESPVGLHQIYHAAMRLRAENSTIATIIEVLDAAARSNCIPRHWKHLIMDWRTALKSDGRATRHSITHKLH
jgi:hypothetical protein